MHPPLIHINQLGRVKRIWYLSPIWAAKVQASLRIHAISPEPLLLAHTSSESRWTVRQKARSLAPLNGWTCAVKICHNGMLEDTNSLDAAQFTCSRCCCGADYWDTMWLPELSEAMASYSKRKAHGWLRHIVFLKTFIQLQRVEVMFDTCSLLCYYIWCDG